MRKLVSTISANTTSLRPRNWTLELFELNPWLAFLLLCLLYGLSTYLVQAYIITEAVYYNTMSEQLTMERIQEIFQYNDKIVWVQVLAIPAVTVLQTALVAFCLNVGTLVANFKIEFRQLFGVVLKASLVFGVGKAIKAIICLFTPIETLDDFMKVDYFSVFGLLANVGLELPELFVYPLGTINIFEVLFAYLLVIGVARLLPRRPFVQVRDNVLASYGIGLFFWVLLIMFFQLNLQ